MQRKTDELENGEMKQIKTSKSGHDCLEIHSSR